jgi:hypothetical protein
MRAMPREAEAQLDTIDVVPQTKDGHKNTFTC